MENRMDVINEYDLKRIEFKLETDIDTLWDLREYRGIFDDCPHQYSVMNRISTILNRISEKLDQNDNETNKKMLKDVVFMVDFFMGDS